MNPLVSVIVMSYNFAEYLRESIGAILNQRDIGDFEVIVIDDASTDSTPAVLQSFSDPRITIVRHETNRGFVYSANEGFARAKGKYVARLDGDDRYRPDFLQTATSILDALPEIGMVYGDVATIDHAGVVTEEKSTRVTPWRTHHGADFRGNRYLPLIFDNCIPAPAILARREAWEKALPIPAGFAFIDWYLNLRIARSYEVYYVSRTLAEYRIHGANLHRNFPRNRAYEQTVLAILDQLFIETDYADEKARIRPAAYFEAFSSLSRRYRTWGMLKDARRCAVRAIREQPARIDRALLRTIAESFLPQPAVSPVTQ